MKILHIEDYFDPSAGYQINELLYASKDFNDEVFLITSNDMSPFHKQFDIVLDTEFENKTGVKIYRLDSIIKISSRLILKELKETIKLINPDVVFMHGICDFKDLQLLKKKSNYKIIRDCHMSWVASKNKFRHLFYFFFRLFFAPIINKTNKYDIIYALGDEEYEYLNKIGINDNKIGYLPHGFNDTLMYYDGNERELVRLQYGFKKNDVVISYIGKFDYTKMPDIILDIVNKFEKKYIDDRSLKLLFIGPKNQDYMNKFNKKLNDIKNIIQVIVDDSKPFSELRKYYSASDICIFPKETTLSSIHAQVCGCPVIMENHKSNRERVIDNNNLFESNDLVQANQILKRIIDNEEFKKSNYYNSTLLDRDYKNQIRKIQRLIKK